MYEHTKNHRVIETDANYVGQLERSKIRWPQDPDRRAGFRAVLGVTTDAELGFRRPRRSRTIVSDVERQQAEELWPVRGWPRIRGRAGPVRSHKIAELSSLPVAKVFPSGKTPRIHLIGVVAQGSPA